MKGKWLSCFCCVYNLSRRTPQNEMYMTSARRKRICRANYMPYVRALNGEGVGHTSEFSPFSKNEAMKIESFR